MQGKGQKENAMQDYVIMTDSSCDLPDELAQELQLSVLPLTFQVKGHEYANYLDGRELGFKEFYAAVRSGEQSVTSAVNMDNWMQGMRVELDQGHDILVLAFSSGLSNTYNAAQLAAKELKSVYPQRKVYVVDTLSASLGQGLLVTLATEKKKQGLTIEAVRDYAEQTKLHLCHWFTVDDLNHLKRGGRISPAVALVGTMLGIKPVMHMDNEGHLVKVGTAKGRLASLRALVDHMEQLAIDPRDQIVYISHGDSQEDAERVADMVKKRFGCKTVLLNYVGPVIGAHSGPGTIALFFVGRER